MNEEELKNKCTERAKIFQQAMKSCHSSSPIDCIEWFADRIADLEKENAELKEELKQWKDGIALKDEEIGCIETDFNTFKSKAKELLNEFMRISKASDEDFEHDYSELIGEAEQFLKE